MILFQKNGHLTNEALYAAVKQVLNEMNLLEVAEHLSFCDGCLERYTALLTDDVLLTPTQPIAPPIFSRIRKRTMGILFNRYTTYAAAACLALTLWGTGVFANLSDAGQLWKNTKPDFSAQTFITPSFSFLLRGNKVLSDIHRSVYVARERAIPTFRSKKPVASNTASRPTREPYSNLTKQEDIS